MKDTLTVLGGGGEPTSGLDVEAWRVGVSQTVSVRVRAFVTRRLNGGDVALNPLGWDGEAARGEVIVTRYYGVTYDDVTKRTGEVSVYERLDELGRLKPGDFAGFMVPWLWVNVPGFRAWLAKADSDLHGRYVDTLGDR